MTRDDVMVMGAGREMDAVVHEVVFHKAVEWRRWYSEFVGLTELVKCNKGDVGALPYEPSVYEKEYRALKVPAYSTDIAAAFEVVQKLGLAIIPQSNPDGGFRWYACDITCVKYYGGGIVIVPKNDSGISCDTAAEAICRAALLAVLP